MQHYVTQTLQERFHTILCGFRVAVLTHWANTPPLKVRLPSWQLLISLAQVYLNFKAARRDVTALFPEALIFFP